MSKPEVRIEDWVFGPIWGNSGPEVIFGRVYGHPNPRLPDGTEVHTSSILKKDLENNRVETLNTNYILGKPRA